MASAPPNSNFIGMPCLMLPYSSSSDSNIRQFFLLSSPSFSASGFVPSTPPFPPYDLANNIYHRLSLPELNGTSSSSSKVYRGLNYANWLLVINSGVDSCPFLYNPITRSNITLPPLPLPTKWNQCLHYPRHIDRDFSIPETPVTRTHNRFLGSDVYMPTVSLAALSSDPSSVLKEESDIEVAVIHGWDLRLSLCRPGGDVGGEWTVVVDEESKKPITSLRVSLAHYNGRFYAIDGNNNLLVVCNVSSTYATANKVALLPNHNYDYYDPKRCSYFLISSNEDLLLIIREDWYRRLEEFKVYKFVEEENEKRSFLKINTIGERAIFLCQDNSFSISSSELVNCNSNCIYFADLALEKQNGLETTVKLIEFDISGNKRNKFISCYPPSRHCLWQYLWFQPKK